MTIRALALGAALLAAGCVAPGDGPALGPATTPAGLPAPTLPETITGLELATAVEIGGANDVAFRPGFAYVSASSGTHVVDISDPANAVVIGSVECGGKDVGVLDLPDGRRIVTISSQGDDKCEGASPAGGIRLVDVTDPTTPVVLGQAALKYGSHTHSPWGDTGLVFNSAYDLVNPLAHHRSEIVDVTDPANPVVAAEFMFPLASKSHGCHDILMEPERSRAICAGITETMIWDMTDPLKPSVTATITNPLISIHHSAATARDGKLLVLGDEAGGVFVPGCNGPAPTGALWFYDIADPKAPKVLGWFGAANNRNAEQIPCTAHNFNVVEGRDLVVSAFYTAGTVLVDFSNPAAPKQVAQVKLPSTVAWASYYFDGHVYAGDGGRGLDVLRLV